MAPEHQERLVSAREIVEIFRWERYAHLAVSFCSAAIVLYAGYKVVISNHPSTAELTLLFGSGGLIAANAGLLLWMFNRVIQIVFNEAQNKPRRRTREN